MWRLTDTAKNAKLGVRARDRGCSLYLTRITIVMRERERDVREMMVANSSSLGLTGPWRHSLYHIGKRGSSMSETSYFGGHFLVKFYSF